MKLWILPVMILLVVGTVSAVPFISTWKTDNPGSSSSTSIQLPLLSGGTYNFNVSWGDGSNDTITAWNQAATLHDYGIAGTYQVNISGTIQGWGFGLGNDADKIIDVSQWGDLVFTNDGDGFGGASYLNISASDAPTLGPYMTNFFYDVTFVDPTVNLSHWDTSVVTNSMQNVFRSSNFNGDISGWDVSNVNSWTGAFGQTVFQGDISGWDLSGSSAMISMFESAEFNQDISSWDVSGVWNFDTMFWGSDFNQSIDAWDTGSVNTMYRMFFGSQYNQPLNSWDVSSVIDMRQMFYQSQFNQPLNSWDTGSVTDMREMFYESQFNQPLNAWNTSSVNTMDSMFRGAQFNQPIGAWDVSGVGDMDLMFYDSNFNQDIGAWDVSSVAGMTQMFSFTNFNQDISSWDTGSVNRMNSMFSNDLAFNQPLGGWDTGSVTTMDSMFWNTAFDQDISGWDTHSLTSTNGMFASTPFNQDISGWNTSLVTNMGAMFQNSSFDQNIGAWDVSSVTGLGMQYLFRYDTLSSDNYDALLAGWSSQSLQSGVTLHAGSSKYTNSAARSILTGTYSWTITDGGVISTGGGGGDFPETEEVEVPIPLLVAPPEEETPVLQVDFKGFYESFIVLWQKIFSGDLKLAAAKQVASDYSLELFLTVAGLGLLVMAGRGAGKPKKGKRRKK